MLSRRSLGFLLSKNKNKMIANALGVVKRQISIRSANQKIKKDCECTRCRKMTCKLGKMALKNVFLLLFIQFRNWIKTEEEKYYKPSLGLRTVFLARPFTPKIQSKHL